MNEVEDVQPGHIYQPGNKKEVRLVYRILSGPYCGRHQKSFSLTKWGSSGAWAAAREAKAFMLDTGRLPPFFASPYSRSRLTNASANGLHCREGAAAAEALATPSTPAEDGRAARAPALRQSSLRYHHHASAATAPASASGRCLDSDEALMGASAASPSLSTRASPLSLPRLAASRSRGQGPGSRGGRGKTASSSAAQTQSVASASGVASSAGGSRLAAPSRGPQSSREPREARLRSQVQGPAAESGLLPPDWTTAAAAEKFFSQREEGAPPTALELASLSLLASAVQQGRRREAAAWAASTAAQLSSHPRRNLELASVFPSCATAASSSSAAPSSADGASLARPALALLQHMARMTPQASAALLKLLEIPSVSAAPAPSSSSAASFGGGDEGQQTAAALERLAGGRTALSFEASPFEALDARDFLGNRRQSPLGPSVSSAALSAFSQLQNQGSGGAAADGLLGLPLDQLLHRASLASEVSLASQASSAPPLSWSEAAGPSGVSAVGPSCSSSGNLFLDSSSNNDGVFPDALLSEGAAAQNAASSLVSQSLYSALASLADAIELQRRSRGPLAFSPCAGEARTDSRLQPTQPPSVDSRRKAEEASKEGSSLREEGGISDSLLKLLREAPAGSSSGASAVSPAVEASGPSRLRDSNNRNFNSDFQLTRQAKQGEEVASSRRSLGLAGSEAAAKAQEGTFSSLPKTHSSEGPSLENASTSAAGALLGGVFSARTRSTTQTSSGGWGREGGGTESEGEAALEVSPPSLAASAESGETAFADSASKAEEQVAFERGRKTETERERERESIEAGEEGAAAAGCSESGLSVAVKRPTAETSKSSASEGAAEEGVATSKRLRSLDGPVFARPKVEPEEEEIGTKALVGRSDAG